jgi:CheY-like chemotaxis protein
MILIVDDVPGVIVAFGAALRRMAVPWQGAGSIAEASALLPQHNWTGFVLDLELPDGSGLELLESLRDQTAYAQTPAAIITASILLSDATVDRVARASASLYCGAFTPPQIEEILTRLIDGRGHAPTSGVYS